MCAAFLGSLVTKYKQPSCSSNMKAILHSLADSKDKSKQGRFLPKARRKKTCVAPPLCLVTVVYLQSLVSLGRGRPRHTPSLTLYILPM